MPVRAPAWSFVVAAALVATACTSSPGGDPAGSSTDPSGSGAGVEAAAPEPVEPGVTVIAGPSRPPVGLELAPGLDDLRADLAAAVASGPQGAGIGVAVLDARGRQVLDVDADTGRLPASTAKVLVAAGALELLGPGARFTTSLEAVGEVDAAGVLDGHLRLVGDGDPTLATADYRTHVYASRPATVLEDLAVQVADAGITAVEGGLRAAADPFGPPTLAPGWKDSYLDDLDARHVTGLTVDAGLAVTVLSQPPALQLEILGEPDPPARLVRSVATALRAEGVALRGPVRPSGGEQQGEVVATVRSEPLSQILRFALERSDNHLADSLHRAIGARIGAPGFLGAGQAVRTVLRDLGVPVTGVQLVDGSGLSRDDRVTARALAAVDHVQRTGELGALWRDLGAEAGSEGTLRRRLRGTVAQGRFIGKTGTLQDVVSIVGTVEDPSGAPAFHVAVIHQDLTGQGQRIQARVVEDLVIQLLAEHAAGCTRTVVAPTEEQASPPPVVACPEAP